MVGRKKRRTRGKSQQNQNFSDNSLSESEDEHEAVSDQAKHEDMEANIILEIKAVRSDMKKEYSEMIGFLKKELTDFREEINQRLSSISTDLQEITQRVEETDNEWPMWKNRTPTSASCFPTPWKSSRASKPSSQTWRRDPAGTIYVSTEPLRGLKVTTYRALWRSLLSQSCLYPRPYSGFSAVTNPLHPDHHRGPAQGL